jgi:hypothetical protein
MKEYFYGPLYPPKQKNLKKKNCCFYLFKETKQVYDITMAFVCVNGDRKGLYFV